MKYLSFILLFLLAGNVNAQLLDSITLAHETEYTELSEALQNPNKVYRLNLRKKKLKEFPKEIYKLKNLQELNLSKNKLKEIPKEIDTLKHLQILDVSANNIDTIYNEIGNCTKLIKLILNQNIIAYLPPTIGNLTNLTFLDLWGNEIQAFPEEIKKLRNTLKIVDLRVINIHDDQQEEIERLLPDTKIFFSTSCNCN
ncbi:MAG TPA: leucine-rich repeat domain-containing protein [Bacteroidales bacterium]|nr:leucine-rich repeat domain-containing protein [Bacteroidales bacterium]HPS16789.1 leucine-rich repeat domain-containing protein [Bacteroidales bacterium]